MVRWMGFRNATARKDIAQSEMFRHFLGPILKDRLNSINPRAWAELEMQYGTRDMGTIALRWMSEKDVWAAMDPAGAHHLTGASKNRAHRQAGAGRPRRAGQARSGRPARRSSCGSRPASLTSTDFSETLRKRG